MKLLRGCCVCFGTVTLIAMIVAFAGCSTSSLGVRDQHQTEMDAYCSGVREENADDNAQAKILETFFSWKAHTCVQVRVSKSENYFSYDIADISHGLFQGPSLIKVDSPLSLVMDDRSRFVIADGYWVSTESSKDKQLVNDIAAHIECNKDEGICRERDGTLFMGMLGSDQHDYKVASWNDHNIVADGEDDDRCGVGHRLIIDSRSKSVVVNDYPKKLDSDPSCKAFQTANSYALAGGSIMFWSIGSIFSCTKDGVDNAIIEKVKELNGNVIRKTYDTWEDDGQGGKPATMKTPDKPYTPVACEQAMQKKIAELKGD